MPVRSCLALFRLRSRGGWRGDENMTTESDAIAALRALMTHPHLCLGDLIYEVRESEGEGWDGPGVKLWSDTVVAAEKLLNALAEEELRLDHQAFGVAFYREKWGVKTRVHPREVVVDMENAILRPVGIKRWEPA